MLNYIWSGMIVAGFLVGGLTGKIDSVTAAAIDGAGLAVETALSLLGSMCLWTGLAKIAEESGLVDVFAKILKPLTKLIFPKLSPSSKAHKAIVLNMVANILGMGNAATPLGIAAMKELDRINKGSQTASDEMCMFVVINTASLQLIPSTIISLRQIYGSQNPTEIIAPVWICSLCALVVGITAAKLFQKSNKLAAFGR